MSEIDEKPPTPVKVYLSGVPFKLDEYLNALFKELGVKHTARFVPTTSGGITGHRLIVSNGPGHMFACNSVQCREDGPSEEDQWTVLDVLVFLDFNPTIIRN